MRFLAEKYLCMESKRNAFDDIDKRSKIVKIGLRKGFVKYESTNIISHLLKMIFKYSTLRLREGW